MCALLMPWWRSARALYAACLGMEELSTRDNQPNAEPIGTLLDLVLALR